MINPTIIMPRMAITKIPKSPKNSNDFCVFLETVGGISTTVDTGGVIEMVGKLVVVGSVTP
jgi:hypothetical protein